MTQQLSNEQAADLFNQFKSVPAEAWDKASPEELSQAIQQAGQDLPNGLTADDLSTGVRVLGKIAHQYDQDIFVEAINDGELPPMKLSNREMEVVRGGFFGAAAAIIAATAAAAAVLSGRAGYAYGYYQGSHEGHSGCSPWQ